MKIIILSAGRGERLMPLTRNTPKSLLDMGGGQTLLEAQIERIKKSGVIDRIVIVVGYLAEQIEAKFHNYSSDGLTISTIYNPFYEVSNNLISLWLAKHEMHEDFLITNGDNLFSYDVFKGLVEKDGNGIRLALNPKERFDDDDMKVIMHNDLIERVSKKIDPDKAVAESPGLSLVRGQKSREIFRVNLEALVRKKEYLNSYWLEVFNYLISKGIAVNGWSFDGKHKWQEVDFHIDLVKAQNLLKIQLEE